VEVLEARVVPQASRTWVSGVGDDANPCSRTAPCKTFAGAISKTAAGGEIDALDPGGFGAVTITKSITIDGNPFQAGVLAAGTNGININAAATDVIVLRGLNIMGIGTGVQGIQVNSAAAVFVEHCNIQQFTGNGIDFNPSGNSELFVTNTTVQNNNPATSATPKAGIYIHPAGTVNARATIDGSHLYNNLNGLVADGNVQVTVSDTVAAGNTLEGFLALNGATINGLATVGVMVPTPTPTATPAAASLTAITTLSMVKAGKKRTVKVALSGAMGAATGRVLFLAGNKIIGIGTLINGMTSLRLKPMQNTRHLSVFYLGDSIYAPSDPGTISLR
jgi:hypothetical protein